MNEINDLILVFCIINSIEIKLIQFEVVHSWLSIAIEFNISFIFKLNKEWRHHSIQVSNYCIQTWTKTSKSILECLQKLKKR